jgi:hypothetical protein
MKQLAKLAVGAAMIGGLAMAASAPADAGVTVRIGVPVHHGYCYYHRCGYHPYYRRAVVVAPYYWHGRHWHHRRWHNGVWVYF